MARAGSNSVTTSGSAVFSPSTDGLATSVRVKAKADNTAEIKVNVAGIHPSGVYDFLEAGESVVYRSGNGGLGIITVLAVSGTQTVRHSVVAVT